MLYKNGLTVLSNISLEEADVRVSKGRIMDIVPRGTLHDPEGEIDLTGRILAPGLIDMHIHGCAGVDFSADKDTSACLSRMSVYLGSRGIAAFASAVMTMPGEELRGLMTRYQKATVNPLPGAAAAGIYLEGPYLSAERCGAQPASCLRLPDIAEFNELRRLSGDAIRVVCVAPELSGADGFIRHATEVCRVSAAHTAGDYDTLRTAIAAGVTHATHLYNGMNPISHRAPGGVVALMEDKRVMCELICDGLHVHPAMVRLTYRLIGADRLCLVSDAMAATGLGDGSFKLGSQDVTVRGNEARLSDGTIAGSVTDLMQVFENAVAFGIPPLDALKAVTINPARALGIDAVLGSVAVGKSARLVVLDQDFRMVKRG